MYRGQNSLWARLQNGLVTFNLFDSESTDRRTIQRERYITRIYLLLLMISIFVIVLYTVASTETATNVISTPFQTQYATLMALYSDTMQCPCTNISVAYKHFITVNNTFHQVCSSDFVKEDWLKFLFGDSIWASQEKYDLRVRGAAYFRFLSALCKISQTTINNAVNQFLTESFVSAQAISQSEFLIQLDVITQLFKKITPLQFSRILKLFRDITHGNTFISSYLLNWYWLLNNRDRKSVV